MDAHRIKKSLLAVGIVGVSLLGFGIWRLTRPSPIYFAYVASVAAVPDIPTQLLRVPFEDGILVAQQRGCGDRYVKTWLFGRLSQPIGHIDGLSNDLGYREKIEREGRYDRKRDEVVRVASSEYHVPRFDYGSECNFRVLFSTRGKYCEIYYEEDTRFAFAWIVVNRWTHREPGELTAGKPSLFKVPSKKSK